MSGMGRYVNLGAVVVPFVGLVVAVVLLWNHGVNALDLGLLAGLYAVTGLAVTVGYHRLLTHRAFQSPRSVEYTLAVLGSMAVEGSVIDWVADHRKHHAHADREGDPHSPHVGDGSGLRGLWHAHVGWILGHGEDRADPRRHARDLLEDRGMRLIAGAFPLLVAVGLALPFAVGLLVGGSLLAGLEAFVWGGLVRVFLLHHVTWSINSICHFFGRRRFATDDQSRNVFWLALPSFGEAWHHNHHAFPRSAAHGLRWWELDASFVVIRLLELVGLARNVVRITPERQRARAVPGGA
jgi:stearoyl-CoA desaturase (Delta-9 desaturase)